MKKYPGINDQHSSKEDTLYAILYAIRDTHEPSIALDLARIARGLAADIDKEGRPEPALYDVAPSAPG